jgi:hypothetical protein
VEVGAVAVFDEGPNLSALNSLERGDSVRVKSVLDSESPDQWFEILEVRRRSLVVLASNSERSIPKSSIVAIRKFEEQSSLVATEPAPLSNLAQEIAALWVEADQAVEVAQRAEKSALESAKACGEKLAIAKSQCPHGQWESWREDNIIHPATGKAIPSSTASLYQRVAERWDELGECWSLREASIALRKPRAISATVADSSEPVNKFVATPIVAAAPEETREELEPPAEEKPRDKRLEFYSPEETQAAMVPQPEIMPTVKKFKAVKYRDTITGQLLESRLVAVLVAINGGSEPTLIKIRSEDVLEVL